MEILNLDLPAMYGDHHVTEVQKLINQLPGIQSVYASSSFRSIEVVYDESKVTPENITGILSGAGYLDNLDIPIDNRRSAIPGDKSQTFFRHTVAPEQTKNIISFAQVTPASSKVLWPCPGIGVINNSIPEKKNG